MYAFYRPNFQKFLMFPDYWETQLIIYFKTCDQGFQTLNQTIGNLDACNMKNTNENLKKVDTMLFKRLKHYQ